MFCKGCIKSFKIKAVAHYDTLFGSTFTLYRIGKHYWRGSDICPNILYYFGKYKKESIAIETFGDFLYPLIIDE